MLRTLRNAWQVPDLRSKLLFTLLILMIYRLGASIVVPYVNSGLIGSFDAMYGGTVLGFMSVLSGGALSQATLFALSVNPYITAQIVMQLLTIAIPPLERIAKEEDGKKKINKWTRYLTGVLAVVTAYGYVTLLNAGDGMGNSYLVTDNAPEWFVFIVIIACFCAGAAVIMRHADKIDEKGIGNGVSMILFANII